MTMRLSPGRPATPPVTDWSGRPRIGRLHRPGHAYRAFRILAAGRRRASVPQP